MNFTIDEQYLTSVTVEQDWSVFQDRDELTQEELVQIIQGKDRIRSISSIDHPEFTKLRDQLENMGYIKTVRNCWNGDSVLKSFTLNGYDFEPGDRFLSATAMKINFQFR